MIAVDVSKWSVQGSVISRDVWRTLKQDHAVELAIVGAWHGVSANPGCRASLENALHEGLRIHTYTVLNGASGVFAVNVARDIVGPAIWGELGRVWLDCELDGIQVSTIRSAFGLLDRWGTPSGVYTARWWWRDHFRDYTGFSGRPLWNALYDGDPDVDFPQYPYGGWSLPEVHGEQYTGTSYVAGIFVDWNYFYDDKVTGVNPVKLAEMERRIFKTERGLIRVADIRRASGLFREVASVIAQADPKKPVSDTQKAQIRFLLGG